MSDLALPLPGIHVASASVDPDHSAFVVRLNRSVDADTDVGWFVLG